MHSQLSEQMQQAQKEKANIAKQMTQMQAQLAHLLNNNSTSNAPMPDPATLEHSERILTQQVGHTPTLAAFCDEINTCLRSLKVI
jgi:chromosome segregation ATPase